MSPGYDLTDLRLFVNVIEHGSITAGAAATHMALASASARVQGLERLMNTPLLVRQHRGVQPTEAGLQLLHRARELVAQAQRLRAEVELRAQQLRGVVRLVGNSAAVREYVPDALGDFLAAHPAVNVLLDELLAADAMRAVAAGEADIAIVTAVHDTGGLAVRPFRKAGFAVVAPRGHPFAVLATQRAVTMADANPHDVVGLSEGSPLQDTWEHRALQHGTRLNYRVRVGSFDAQMRLIERGVGLSLMPDGAARRLAVGRAVEVVGMPDEYLNRPLLLCTRPGPPLPVQVAALLEGLCASAA